MTAPNVPLPLLSTAEAAERLGVSVWTVHRWVDAGRLTAAAKGPGLRGALLFTPAEVDRLKSENEASS